MKGKVIMSKTTFVLCFTVLYTTMGSGQGRIDQLLSKADSAYFDHKDYSTALVLYKQIKERIDSTHLDYKYTVDKIARTIFYLEHETRSKNEVEKSIELSEEFINLVDKYSKYIDSAVIEKKYFMYKNMIIGYFALKQGNKAQLYQKKLYRAYENKALPKGIDKSYNFEKITWDSLNVWGYEWYPQLGDSEAEGSFSKHIYYVYSTDDQGGDKNLLYTLETVKIHKFKGNEPDYVLTKRTYGKGWEESESIWSSTFYDPIDYDKLHEAVIAFLKGNVESDTKSKVEYGKGRNVKIKK